MVDPISFGIIGGDKRQVFLANSLLSDGVPVLACGFERLKGAAFLGGVEQRPLAETAERAGVLLLPLPATRDGKTLNAPFAQAPIRLDEAFAKALLGHRVLAGKAAALKDACPALRELPIADYGARESFARQNAAITAEGALFYALRAMDKSLCGSRCLVAGFGRVGQAVAVRLYHLFARVTVAARREASRAAAAALGCRTVSTADLYRGGAYDLVINTVPALLFPRAVLEKFPKTCIFLDLSSAPGGIDLAAAESLHLHAEQAFSLPGKTAPRAAAESIKQSVYSILKGCEES